jgi:hypothetical protein
MPKTIFSPKRRGEWVELQFMARAAGKGFTVSKPWGDSARYDFAVEYGGRFHRVQVKSTMQQAQRGRGAYLCNTVSRGPIGPSRGYTARDVDFFAFFIIPEELWYIVPIADVRRARTAVYLNPSVPRNRWFRYLEAWDLLKDSDTWEL